MVYTAQYVSSVLSPKVVIVYCFESPRPVILSLMRVITKTHTQSLFKEFSYSFNT